MSIEILASQFESTATFFLGGDKNSEEVSLVTIQTEKWPLLVKSMAEKCWCFTFQQEKMCDIDGNVEGYDEGQGSVDDETGMSDFLAKREAMSP